MGLVLLRKGSQCSLGSVFIPFDPPTCVIIVNENGCDSEYAANTLMCNNNYF